MRLNHETVGPQYFQTMRIPLVHGRDFDETGPRARSAGRGYQRDNGATVLAKSSALGQRLKLTGDWLEIVGIAKDVKNRSLSEPPQPFSLLAVATGLPFKHDFGRPHGNESRTGISWCAGSGRRTRHQHAPYSMSRLSRNT